MKVEISLIFSYIIYSFVLLYAIRVLYFKGTENSEILFTTTTTDNTDESQLQNELVEMNKEPPQSESESSINNQDSKSTSSNTVPNMEDENDDNTNLFHEFLTSPTSTGHAIITTELDDGSSNSNQKNIPYAVNRRDEDSFNNESQDLKQTSSELLSEVTIPHPTTISSINTQDVSLESSHHSQQQSSNTSTIVPPPPPLPPIIVNFQSVVNPGSAVVVNTMSESNQGHNDEEVTTHAVHQQQSTTLQSSSTENNSNSNQKKEKEEKCGSKKPRRARAEIVRGTSSYVGVRWHKASQKWQAQIYHEGTVTHLGLFDTEVDAAKKFDEKASSLGRPVNFPFDGTLIHIFP
jgi:hypothetical protein